MSKIIIVISAMRLPFLLLTPVCVLLGASVVVYQGHEVNTGWFILALIGGLSAHIAVNTLNEYQDFRSGLDFKTTKTPFSGGSGALPSQPDAAKWVLITSIISLLLVVLIGIMAVVEYGAKLIPIGLAGLFVVITYTNWINRHPVLCLVAPGIGFGLLMVVGSQFVLTGEYSALAWWVALVPFALANTLLLLNQYPDIAADKQVGRYHFPIAFGVSVSNWVYAVFQLFVLVLIVVMVAMAILPKLSLIALLPMLLAFIVLYGVFKYGETIADKPIFLALNVAVSLLTPLLLAVSLF